MLALHCLHRRYSLITHSIQSCLQSGSGSALLRYANVYNRLETLNDLEVEKSASITLNSPSPSTADPLRNKSVISARLQSRDDAIISVPPGLSLPQDFPPLIAPSKPSASASPSIQRSNTAGIITPVVPVIPTARSAQTVPLSKEARDPGTVLNQTAVPTVTQSVLRPTIVTNVEVSVNENAEKSDNALIDAKIPHSITVSSNELPKRKDSLHLPDESLTKDSLAKDDNGLGPLDISPQKHTLSDPLGITPAKYDTKEEVGVAAPSNLPSRPATPVKAPKPATSVPSQPATLASQTSVSAAPRQAQPRTIRVVQAQKMEPPPRPPAIISANSATTSTVSKQLSRQPSLASLHQPGTPQNEMISDNASLTSASISRPGSPPPNKVGSAPIRQTTKSQQKKERQARAKKLEEGLKSEEPAADPVSEGPIQAPIIGRKKKAKKAIAAIFTDSTSAGSGPPSPPIDETPSKDDVAEDDVNATPVTPVKETKKSRKSSKKGSKKDNSQSQASVQENSKDPELTLSEAADALQKTLLSAASIFENLLKSNEISANALDLFRQPPGLNHRYDLTDSDFADAKATPSLTDAQHNLLQQGVAISVETGNDKWAVILPDRRILRGYTRKEADRYLQLRAKIIAAEGPGVFSSTSHSMEQVLHASTPQSMPPFTEGHNPATSSSTDQYNSEPFFEDSIGNRLGSFGGSKLWGTLQGYRAGAGQRGDEAGQKGTTMSVEEAEKALLETRKETEALEKRLAALVKKNKRLLVGSGH